MANADFSGAIGMLESVTGRLRRVNGIDTAMEENHAPLRSNLKTCLTLLRAVSGDVRNMYDEVPARKRDTNDVDSSATDDKTEASKKHGKAGSRK